MRTDVGSPGRRRRAPSPHLSPSRSRRRPSVQLQGSRGHRTEVRRRSVTRAALRVHPGGRCGLGPSGDSGTHCGVRGLCVITCSCHPSALPQARASAVSHLHAFPPARAALVTVRRCVTDGPGSSPARVLSCCPVVPAASPASVPDNTAAPGHVSVASLHLEWSSGVLWLHGVDVFEEFQSGIL